jgi:hypothetical protein
VMELEEGWGAAAVAEADPRVPVPWEDPELSALAGFFRTLREVLFQPGEFFANLGGEGWAEPLAFALIASSLGLLGTLFWQFLVMARSGLSPGIQAALMAGAPVLVLANLGVGGICWWGSVALVGGGRDFTPAWRVFCYAQGGMVLGLMPLFGMVVAGIWVLALMYCGVKEVCGLSAGGSLGALAVFLSLQAGLALILLLSLATLAGLGFLLLLLG